MKPDTHHGPASQRGATLVIAMVMLILVTLFVIAAVNMSTTNLRVMGNEQSRNESLAAAQQAIEQVSSIDFTKNPAGAPGVATPILVDINGDGTNDYSVTVSAPTCLNSIPVKLTELNPLDTANDVPCFGSAASSAAGLPGGTGTGNSFCSATQWDIGATATDAATNSGATVTPSHQGVSARRNRQPHVERPSKPL